MLLHYDLLINKFNTATKLMIFRICELFASMFFVEAVPFCQIS